MEQRLATAPGWHRAFCLKLTRWRGSAAQPGLMMGLRRGGRCRGVIYRIADDQRGEELMRLLRREVGREEAMTGVRWLSVETAGGKLRALTFWAEPVGVKAWVKLPLREVAHILARACGHIGSGAAYLFQTVSALDQLGIRDRNLWRLQELVAREIHDLHRASEDAGNECQSMDVMQHETAIGSVELSKAEPRDQYDRGGLISG